MNTKAKDIYETAPATDAARQWSGWGTALKPALEPITVARKPLAGTVAANVLAHGCGGINVDGCRVGITEDDRVVMDKRSGAGFGTIQCAHAGRQRGERFTSAPAGRWPANLIHDGSDEVTALFPNTGPARTGKNQRSFRGWKSVGEIGDVVFEHIGDSGSAARFFKCCPPDEICSLCDLTWSKASDTVHIELQERSSLWKNMFALSAEKNGWTSEATAACTARMSAITSENEKLVQNVKSAGSLCDSCATRIAVGLVGIKTSAFSEAELQAILDCTGNCNASILTRCLASFAGLWENTATIPTTTSLSLLFGSVRDAIANYTKPESAEAAGQKSAQRRFAYHSKASKRDRDEGCEGMEERTPGDVTGGRQEGSAGLDCPRAGAGRTSGSRNHHPTVKPTDLMRYLCRLVTPPGGIVLDPFMGSGSTGKAALREGFRFIGIERDPEAFEIARTRLENELRQGLLPLAHNTGGPT